MRKYSDLKFDAKKCEQINFVIFLKIHLLIQL